MKRLSLAVVVAIAAASGACKPEEAPKPSPAASAAGMTDQEKTLYALGVVLGKNIEPLGFTPAEIETIKKGLTDTAGGKKPEVDMQIYGPKIQELAQARVADHAKSEKAKSRAFADTAAKETGAVQTASGMVYRTVTPGKGASPAATDTVRVHYTGTLTDGTEFDSSVKRGKPVEFELNKVIPCWTEGVQKMKVGEKARLVCPSDIAYGDQGRAPVIPGGATLIFDVELLDIVKKN